MRNKMYFLNICLIIACIVCFQTNIVFGIGHCGKIRECEWLSWDDELGRAWTSCTRSCGGGTRTRTRSMCCPKGYSDLYVCMAHCGKNKTGYYERKICGDVCYNSGIIVHYGSGTRAGRCHCTLLYTGSCCTERTCSWDNYYCWPGRCSNNRASYCRCAPGFHQQAGPSETTCQLESTNTPSIEKCDTEVLGQNGEIKQASSLSSSSDCSDLKDFYGNFKPTYLVYDLFTRFAVNVSSYTKPAFIHGSNFGVSDVSLRVEVQSISGAISILVNHTIFAGASNSSDVVLTKDDKYNLSLGASPPQLTDGQWLCVIYEAYGGGFLRSMNLTQVNRVPSAPLPYKKTKATRRICYRYDSSPPEHCKQDNSCTYEPLQISDIVTRVPLLTVTFQGWSDPVPQGGNASHASGIKSYQLTVHEIVVSKNVLKVDTGIVHTEKVGSSVASLTVNLASDTPKLYALYLKVTDETDNFRQTRRFVLFDESYHIDIRHKNALYVDSASPESKFKWQTNHNDICLNWTGHFYNTLDVDNPLLNPVEPDPSGLINGVYEQKGMSVISRTPNVSGIVEFRTSWSLNGGTFSFESKVQNFQRQHYCNNFNVTDGETYTINIRAVDIAGNSYAENRTVHIDRSAPHINNIRLVKDGEHRRLFVHDRADSSNVKLYFEAMDRHSGIREIRWAFGTSEAELVIGQIATNRIDKGCPGGSVGNRKCYCPDVGMCEFYQYSLPLIDLMAADKNISDQNRTFYFTIKATNHALLYNVEHLDFLANGTMIMSEVSAESSTISTAAIAGVAVGAIVGLATVAACTALVMMLFKKKQTRTEPHTEEKDRL